MTIWNLALFILLQKLKHGIRGLTLNWFNSYLNSREQFTVVNGCLSQSMPIRRGVPHGSILGPLLFLIYMYINDIPNCTQSLNYILFADDTSVFSTGKDLATIYNSVNYQLQNISEWMFANKLILNIDKTNYIIFGTRNKQNCNMNLYYRNKSIDRVSHTKFLGVYVDENFSWNYHVNQLCNNIAKNVGIMNKLHFLPQDVLKLLYHSLISSNVSWGCTSQSNINRIHKLQKHAVRIITHSKYIFISKRSVIFQNSDTTYPKNTDP